MKLRNVDQEIMIKPLVIDEGLATLPYTCPAGYLTIGVGRNLATKGINQLEAKYMLTNDIRDSMGDLDTIFMGLDLPQEVWMILINMHFNLGPNGFRKFPKLISAIRCKNFFLAAYEMKNSRWFRQVGNRSQRLYIQMIEVATSYYDLEYPRK